MTERQDWAKPGHYTRCRSSGKRAWPSRAEAKRAARTHYRKQRIRVYRCPACDQFHHTTTGQATA